MMEPHVLEEFLDLEKLKMAQRILQASDFFPVLMLLLRTSRYLRGVLSMDTQPLRLLDVLALFPFSVLGFHRGHLSGFDGHAVFCSSWLGQLLRCYLSVIALASGGFQVRRCEEYPPIGPV